MAVRMQLQIIEQRRKRKCACKRREKQSTVYSVLMRTVTVGSPGSKSLEYSRDLSARDLPGSLPTEMGIFKISRSRKVFIRVRRLVCTRRSCRVGYALSIKMLRM